MPNSSCPDRIAGASGLLVMGSMGNESYLRNCEYTKVARCSAAAAKGQIPVLVGVTDVSIGRVMDRVEAISDIEGIDGIVSTVPYYATVKHLKTTGREVSGWYRYTTEFVMQTLADLSGYSFTMDSYDEETGAASYRFTK